MNHHNGHRPYLRLALMAMFSFIAMFILMYSMVAALPDAIPNFNQAYMAGLMTAPMILIELWLMSSMYPNKRLNRTIALTSVIAGVALFLAIQTQFFIGDRQFLKSMIPHHSGAILMCQKADLSDPAVKDLCEGIIEGQTQEIRLMRQLLE